MLPIDRGGVRKLLLTTVPGLEDLLLEEVQRIAPGRGALRRGRVLYELERAAGGGELSRMLSKLTLAEKVRAVVAEGRARELGGIRRLVLSAPALEGLGRRPLFFAVEAEREGDHSFTSVDVARVVGSAIQELYPNLRVSLDDPDVLLYAELIEDEFRLAIDLTPFISLKDRGYRVYVHPSSLNPIVARSMVRIARLKAGETLVDPMCGSGTIVIEGLLDQPAAVGLGFDVNPRHVRGALLNASTAGVVADFAVADVRRLSRTLRESVDVLAANPPYGIRERPVGGLAAVYRALFRAGRATLREGGRLVVLSPLKGLVERASRLYGWSPASVRQIEMGGLAAFIYLFERE